MNRYVRRAKNAVRYWWALWGPTIIDYFKVERCDRCGALGAKPRRWCWECDEGTPLCDPCDALHQEEMRESIRVQEQRP